MPTSPSLAEGVELVGEYEGSGFKVPPSIVQRADGQVIQLPPLLYSVAAKLDGRHDADEIATEVSSEIGRDLDASQVQFLIDDKLRPLGIVTEPDGSTPEVDKPDPFLAFRFRLAVIPERTSGRLGAVFAPLFHPLVVVAALLAFVATDVWLFFVHGVAQSLRQTLYHPGYFLPLLGAIVLAAAFHETGHAAGCRYGGCSPGKMGAGLYLAWPAFYTDVTDAYRLDKRGRLRTDLGGVYFNVVVVLLTTALYAITGLEPLLLLVVVQHFEIAHQLLPVIRLDGYYIVADMTGVPDLFSRIGPILRSMVPGRATDERVVVLKRWVRVAVTAWVLIVVPLLIFELGLVLMNLPRIIATSWDSSQQLWTSATSSFSTGDVVAGVSSVVQVVVLVIPVLGIMLMLAKLGRQTSVAAWQRTRGHPVGRALTILLAAGVLALLLPAWIQRGNYTPIQPDEKGTLPEVVDSTRAMWSAMPRRPAVHAEPCTNGTFRAVGSFPVCSCFSTVDRKQRAAQHTAARDNASGSAPHLAAHRSDPAADHGAGDHDAARSPCRRSRRRKPRAATAHHTATASDGDHAFDAARQLMAATGRDVTGTRRCARAKSGPVAGTHTDRAALRPPGCAHAARPSSCRTRRPRCSTGRSATASCRQPRHAAHVRTAATRDGPLRSHRPRRQVDDRDRALVAVRHEEILRVAADVQTVRARTGRQEPDDGEACRHRSPTLHRRPCPRRRRPGRRATASRPAVSSPATERSTPVKDGSSATVTFTISLENSQLASRYEPSAEKSRWSTPLHGTGIDFTSANVCGSRKSSRARRSATTMAKRPSGREVQVVRDHRPGSVRQGASGRIDRRQRVALVGGDVQRLQVVRRDDVLRFGADVEVIHTCIVAGSITSTVLLSELGTYTSDGNDDTTGLSWFGRSAA